ncbi:MAG: AMP-binding protein [Anaerolineales bacterium]|jgi:acyl-CoA synthetase (AMP-forming)/AMP-acid ligase II
MIPLQETIPEVLLHRYRETPEQVAVVLRLGIGERALTVRDLFEGAAGYAREYQGVGARPGDVVIDLLAPGADLLYAFLGATLVGAVPTILPFLTEKLDPERYQESLDNLIRLTRPVALVAEPVFAAKLRARFLDTGKVKAVLDPGPRAGGSPLPNPASWQGLRVGTQSLALLQHSSGTTGLQKGVALSHAAVFRQLSAYLPALHYSASDVVVSWLPLYHDMGLIAGFLLPLLAGGKLVLLSPFDWVRAPWSLLQAVSDHHGTLSWLPNFAYNFCASHVPESELAGVDLSSWRAVINCSEPMVADSHRLFAKRFRANGLHDEALATCYAMAENVFAATQGGIEQPVWVDRVDGHVLAGEGRAKPADAATARTVEVVSAGPPLGNCQLGVVDAQGRPRADREVGELVLHSDCMLQGYFNRPDATAEALGDGWYRTGDLGYLANGEVFITGRKKDLMIVGGKNIYPQDIEYLINRVPGVHPGRAVVFGLFNPVMGTEEVAAVVEVDSQVSREEARLSLAIRQAVATGSEVTLGPLKLVDERWLLKTSSGKIARAANREKLLAERDRTLGAT